jgi:hypothetical protein
MWEDYEGSPKSGLVGLEDGPAWADRLTRLSSSWISLLNNVATGASIGKRSQAACIILIAMTAASPGGGTA